MLNQINGTGATDGYDNQRLQGKKRPPDILHHEVRIPDDKVSLDEKPAEAITYGIPGKTDIQASNYTTLREMIVNILEGQGLTTRIADGDTSIDFREITPDQARELISEDGYFGVGQTSDRIVQLAISLNGSNPGQIEEIKAGIEKGFQLAANALNGTLPDISMKTYDAVMDKLDAWAQGADEV